MQDLLASMPTLTAEERARIATQLLTMADEMNPDHSQPPALP